MNKILKLKKKQEKKYFKPNHKPTKVDIKLLRESF